MTTTYSKEVNIYNTEAIQDAIDEAGETASSYITTVDQTGIMVHPANDSTSGWKISSALELLKSGVRYIKAWLAGANSDIPTVRIGQDSAGHTDFTPTGMEVYSEASSSVAMFGSDGARIGNTDENYAMIDEDSFDIYHNNTQMVHFGYGESSVGGSTSSSPYYTIGSRLTTTSVYSSQSTYNYGDHVLYNSKEYVCKRNITTPESWNYQHWEYVVGSRSVVNGVNTTACGYKSYAEGEYTTASGVSSHAENYRTKSIGDYSHAEGNQTQAGDIWSETNPALSAKRKNQHSEGYGSKALGDSSHAQNKYTIAASQSQTALGEFNIADTYEETFVGTGSTMIITLSFDNTEIDYVTVDGINYLDYSYYGGAHSNQIQTATSIATGAQIVVRRMRGNYAAIIGNGTADNARSNALAVDWNGNVLIAGGVKNMSGTQLYANASHTHSYLPLAGGTMTGSLNINSANLNVFNGAIYKQSTNSAYDRDGAAPSSTFWSTMMTANDKDGNAYASLTTAKRSTSDGGWNDVGLYVYSHDGTNQIQNYMILGIKPDGTKRVAIDREPWIEALGIGGESSLTFSSNVSIPNSTYAVLKVTSGGTTYDHLSLAAGTWVITGGILYASKANGQRYICITTASGSTAPSSTEALDCAEYVDCNSTATQVRLSTTRIVKITSTTNYYLKAWQSSGSALDAQGKLHAVRIA